MWCWNENGLGIMDETREGFNVITVWSNVDGWKTFKDLFKMP